MATGICFLHRDGLVGRSNVRLLWPRSSHEAFPSLGRIVPKSWHHEDQRCLRRSLGHPSCLPFVYLLSHFCALSLSRSLMRFLSSLFHLLTRTPLSTSLLCLVSLALSPEASCVITSASFNVTFTITTQRASSSPPYDYSTQWAITAVGTHKPFRLAFAHSGPRSNRLCFLFLF